MSNKHKILFVCIRNSARSQMAEAFEQQIKTFVQNASTLSYWIPATETNPSH